MKNLLLMTIALVMVVTSSAQDRNVFWTHGFQDNADFWNAEYARAERDYKINSTGFTYTTTDGVQAYANRIKNGSQSVAGTNTIGIGHSMGGVALREADRDYPNLHGGYITFGSPLDGARLANETINGTGVTRFITQSVDNLRRGPIASSTRSKWQVFNDGITDAITGGGMSVVIRTFASAAILDVTEDLTEGFEEAITTNFNPNSQSIKDLAENSTYMNSVKSFSNSKPKIKVWGDEDSPVHARMFVSSITLDDNFANLLLTAYNTVANSYKSTADGISTGWTPFCWDSCRDRKRREKEAWNAGYDYLNRGWEIAWNELIDSRYTEQYTTLEQQYVCNSGLPGPLQVAPIEEEPCLMAAAMTERIDCDDCYWVWVEVTRTRWVNTPSDGFIKSGSQKGEKSNWGGTTVRIAGVNHLEMGVHPNTNLTLRRAFNGQYGGYFTTTTR